MSVPPDEEKPTAGTGSPVKPPRSSKERLLVWGGIGLLLVLVAVQAQARFGYEKSREKLQTALNHDSGNNTFFSIKDVDQHIVGWASRQESEPGKVTYTWSGLGRHYGLILKYDPKDPAHAVTDLVTVDAPEPAPPPPLRELTYAEWYWLEQWFPPPPKDYHFREVTYPYEGFNPLRFDDNGDKKLSKAEAPPQMHYCFDQLDANHDGFVDHRELEALLEKNGKPVSGAPENKEPRTK